MGYGTAIGLVAAGALATQITVSPSRVMLIDLGVGGGALIGAAVASPLIFDNVTEAKTRGWLSATLGGSVAGGVLGWWLTRDGASLKRPAWLRWAPEAGVIGASATPRGQAPVLGLKWSGAM
jgi:hypothetical protein